VPETSHTVPRRTLKKNEKSKKNVNKKHTQIFFWITHVKKQAFFASAV
tara:strand:- start:36 stop:179 length:144 start_codon:yes stop_codon:yes gene_type:complete